MKTDQYINQYQMVVELSADNVEDRLAVIESLKSNPLVVSYSFKSPEESMEELLYADPKASNAKNTFGYIIRATLSEESAYLTIKQSISNMPGVYIVHRGDVILDIMYSYGYYALISLLLIATAFMIYAARSEKNKVRESIKARFEDCKILKSFGASPRFIKAPFFIEVISSGIAAFIVSYLFARFAVVFLIGQMLQTSTAYAMLLLISRMPISIWSLAIPSAIWLAAFLSLSHAPDPNPAFPEIY